MVTIKSCTVEDVQHSALAEEYASYAIAGLPKPQPQWERYKLMEAAGVISVFGAFDDDQIVGFISTIGYLSLHYGVDITLTESFFVAKQYRKTGAGVKLLRAVEQMAKANGSAGLMITAPHNKELARVLTVIGYKQSHEVFFKCMR
jgi:GNAT superfamily N-acetyltransferase